jgi:hypothetical protein
MMTRKYSLLHLPVFAFFSKRLYREIGRNWKGANLCYLFLLLAICWIPPTMSIRERMISSLQHEQMHIINQLPDIRIEDGLVRLEQTEPLRITRQDGSTFAIIDTTGSMNYIDDDGVMALLTEEELIIRRGKKEFNTLDLAQVSEFHINQEILGQWINTTKHALAPLSYGIFLMLSYIFTVMVLLLMAIFGLILSTLMNASLKYTAIVRLAAAAATPSLIMITASAAYGIVIPGAFYAGLTLIYLLLGILACKAPESEPESPKLKLALLIDDEEQHSNAA